MFGTMRKFLLLAGLGFLTSAVLAALLLGVFEAPAHTDYALEKALHREKSGGRILWHAMSVEAAYQAVGQRRTPFAPAQAQASRDRKEYLVSLLALTDAALAERVSMQLRLQGGAGAAAPGGEASNYEAILESIKGLPSPRALVPAEALLYQAIDEQRRYLALWESSGERGFFNPEAPLVVSSHEKIAAARQKLLHAFREEGLHNRRAVSDHLTALDFR